MRDSSQIHSIERPYSETGLLLGTSAFTAAGWESSFYPAGMKSRDCLSYYSRQFATVELDSTFYGTPSASTVTGWYEKTPPDFVFAAKVPQIVTHQKMLVDCEAESDEFIDRMGLLREKLGPLLLQFLQWKDFDGERLSVKRTVWRTTQSLPKTESSENTVPVLPILQSFLENYRQYLEGPLDEDGLGKTLNPTTWMFAGGKHGTSMNLPNLVRRTIVPNLTRCEVCHFPKQHHAEQDKDHAFKLDESIPKWKGWHSFRRSLGSNLYALGMKPKIIQAILRHSDIATTLGFYVETSEAESREALDKLTALMG